MADIVISQKEAQEKKQHPQNRLKGSAALTALFNANGSYDVDLDKKYSQLIESINLKKTANPLNQRSVSSLVGNAANKTPPISGRYTNFVSTSQLKMMPGPRDISPLSNSTTKVPRRYRDPYEDILLSKEGVSSQPKFSALRNVPEHLY